MSDPIAIVRPPATPVIVVQPASAAPIVVVQPNLYLNQAQQRVEIILSVAHVYTPNAATTDVGLIILPTADFTVATPSSTPFDEQRLLIKIKSDVAGYIPSWGSGFSSSGIAILPTTALPVSKTVTFGFIYDAAAGKWILLAADAVGY